LAAKDGYIERKKVAGGEGRGREESLSNIIRSESRRKSPEVKEEALPWAIEGAGGKERRGVKGGRKAWKFLRSCSSIQGSIDRQDRGRDILSRLDRRKFFNLDQSQSQSFVIAFFFLFILREIAQLTTFQWRSIYEQPLSFD